MSYDANQLSALSYANGFTIWHYRAHDDALAAVLRDRAYFLRAQHMLRRGDQMIVNAIDGNAACFVDQVVADEGVTFSQGGLGPPS